MKKKKIANYLKIGTLLFGISLFLWNCEKDFQETNTFHEKIESLNAKTVSFLDAKNFFIQNKRLKEQFSKNSNSLQLSPNWNSLSHHQIYGTDVAKLTQADVTINRKGNYTSKLYFLEVDGKMRNVIFTIYKKDTTSTGGIINATVYFNKINGEFMDGYIIKEGKFSKRIIVTKKQQTQQASFFSFSSLFQDTNYIWNEENFPEDGLLDVVNLGYIGGRIDFDAPFFSNNYASDTNDNTQLGTVGFVTSTTGIIFATMNIDDEGNCTGGKMKDENENCICRPGYIEDSNGDCVEEAQIFNQLTGKADCVYGKMEENSLLKKTLNKFNGKDTPVNLVLKLDDISDPNIAGETDYGNSNFITISLDNDYMNNSPSLFVALTILHEAIHAEIYRKIKTTSGFSYNSTTNKWELPNGSEANFPTLFNYYNDSPNNPHHNYMADYYRNAIEQGLRDYASSNGLTFSDQLYSDLAWGGLQGTNAWNSMYADVNYTINEQTRIKTAISNFIKSSNNECN